MPTRPTNRKEFFQIAAAVIGAEVAKDGAAPEGVLHLAAEYYRAAQSEWGRIERQGRRAKETK